MKHFKLFPKTFLYTLLLMLLITFLANGLVLFLAPRKGVVQNGNENIVIEQPHGDVFAFEFDNNIAMIIFKALPLSILICVAVSFVCAFLFSREITKPINHITATTGRMAALDKTASCKILSKDEIETLADNINQLYSSLIITIENLELEKEKAAQTEHQKIDFLRAASHELKTPVTAINAMLENMIMEVGKYKDYATYLPKCKELSGIL